MSSQSSFHKILVWGLWLVWLMTGCQVTFSGDYENTPEGNFDFFFHELDNFYAYSDYTFEDNLTLKEIQELERSNLLADPSWDNLASVLGRVVYSHILDPHIDWINVPIDMEIENLFLGKYREKRSNEFDNYYGFSNFNSAIKTDYMEYMVFSNYGGGVDLIGYIHITRLDRNQSLSISEENRHLSSIIDNILKEFRIQGVERIIIDIRSPAGGSAYLAEIIASRFIHRKVKYSIFSEFTPKNSHKQENKYDKYIAPMGYAYYQDKPVVILVNTLTCSAGEILLLMLRQSGGPNKANRVIGTPTLGCPGNTSFRMLPNGWIFQLTINRSYEEDGRDYLGVGIRPDTILPNDLSANMVEDDVFNLAVDTVRGLE